jgi:hypothetical protein
MENQKTPDVLLEDLLSGQDRLLTSGEVAEILNVNANTLYLWRTSSEVNLPYQRFVAPGQTRGMIRYRYSDVARFIAEARLRGDEDRAAQESTGTQKLELTIEVSDEEELAEYNERLARRNQAAERKRLTSNKKKKERLREIPLEDAVKFAPEFVPNPPENVEDEMQRKAREFIESLSSIREE